MSVSRIFSLFIIVAVICAAICVTTLITNRSSFGDDAAAVQLARLKAQIPELLAKWVSDNEDQIGPETGTQYQRIPEILLLRRIDAHRAKATILLAAKLGDERDRAGDVLLTLFFSYGDKCWTVTQFQIAGKTSAREFSSAVSFLVAAIDQASSE